MLMITIEDYLFYQSGGREAAPYGNLPLVTSEVTASLELRNESQMEALGRMR